MEINLISDTFTKPSTAMLDAMIKANVGDDVYRQDPTAIELENRTAKMFGMQAGLYFPSGTMANQTGIKLHTQPGDQIIADKWSHIYLYEGGGAAVNSNVSFHLIDGNYGKINANQVLNAINDPENIHLPLSKLVSIENTTNKGGGACYDIAELKAIKKVCQENNLKFHLDGARIWNALIAKNQDPKEFGQLFDSISVCFSKGLGAPIGSVLLSDTATIKRALRIRKIMGGAMRQVGYLAAAGIFALENNINRLCEDHKRAKELAQMLNNHPAIKEVAPVETNIVIFSLHETYNDNDFIEKLKQKNILISSMGQGKMRMVTHLDYTEEMHQYVLSHF